MFTLCPQTACCSNMHTCTLCTLSPFKVLRIPVIYYPGLTSDLTWSHFSVGRRIYKSRLMHGLHTKLFIPCHSPFGVSRVQGSKFSSTKQVLSGTKSAGLKIHRLYPLKRDTFPPQKIGWVRLVLCDAWGWNPGGLVDHNPGDAYANCYIGDWRGQSS